MMGVLRFFGSLRLTVSCLVWLCVLLVWGTWVQRELGLHLAQDRFFYSWFILAGGFIPLPGGGLTLGLLTVNLLISLMVHMTIGWRMWGITLTHAGLLLLLTGGFFHRLTTEEAYLPLLEGQGSNVAWSYTDWEISLWASHAAVREVTAVDEADLRDGTLIDLPPVNCQIVATRWDDHAVATETGDREIPTAWEAATPGNDPQTHLPAAEITLTREGSEPVNVSLYGGAPIPQEVHLGEDCLHIVLRRKRLPLPAFVELIQFKKELHPNSQSFKSFTSVVELRGNDTHRTAVIEMNKPLRLTPYTFFQASFAEGNEGKVSQFAVTRHFGRLLPYISSGMVFVGMAGHFLGQMIAQQRQQRRRKEAAA